MKLSGEIIFQNLKKSYKTEIDGTGREAAVLMRPEFYMENSEDFLSGHLYLATAEHLPRRPRIEKNCALICIGENMNIKYYRERLCLITIRNRADFFRVFQTVQNIFDRYDSWEKTLLQDLVDEADIQKLLADSHDIFARPLTVLDKRFRVIASLPDISSLPSWGVSSTGTLTTESLESFLRESSLLTEKKGAIRLEINGIRTLSVNLFSADHIYQGCLCISAGSDDFRDGDDRCAEFLASVIEKAAARNPEIINDSDSSVRSLFQTLIGELPISPSQRCLLNAVNRRNTYVCVSLHSEARSERIPFGYMTEVFEETFPKSFAFIQDNEILGFISTGPLTDSKTNDFKAELNVRLRTFLKQMYLYAGISDPFMNLFDIRIHYAQAQCAADNGKLINPTDNLYWFASYALAELVINSLGGLPAEAYFPAGLSSLIEHDRTSGVSYLETLKVFLEENMSNTAAAARLYVHRSTLIDRIARIERDLQIDLKDPDQRLLLEILIKAIDIEKMMENRT